MLYRIRRWLRLLFSHRSVDRYLDLRCTDWTLEMMDWPPQRHQCYPTLNTCFHYRCRVYGLWWERGSGYGRTAREAARRAVTHMSRKGRQQGTAT